MISRKKRLSNINSDAILNIQKSLQDNQKVNLKLPAWGRLYIDRCLPFIVVYRRPKHVLNTAAYRLVTAQASYLIARDDTNVNEELFQLIYGVSQFLKKSFGACMAIEVWESKRKFVADVAGKKEKVPRCKIFYQVQDKEKLWNSLEVLKKHLSKIAYFSEKMRVDFCETDSFSPPGMISLAQKAKSKIKFFYLGIEIDPIYKDETTGRLMPLVFQKVRKTLSAALRESFYKFSLNQTTHAPAHYNALGRRAIVSKVWEVDKGLAEVADAFDFLLQVTPINQTYIWEEFKKARFKKISKFYYRPLLVDPIKLKQSLFKIPIGKIEDPSLSDIFVKKQFELERKINMLFEIDTPRFLYASLQLYGRVEQSLKDAAINILAVLKKEKNKEKNINTDREVSAEKMLLIMKKELKVYQRIDPSFKSIVEIRDDIISGAMVSNGNILIGKGSKFLASRIEGLIHHEIGTHILTYHNGLCQPFQQLHTGLVGYDELQEGLAVLSEYFVDGLTRTRLRTLAARVLAAESMIAGASFIETFNLLKEAHSFSARGAFNITFRLYRGGGYTKDMIYLRGFLMILDYLKRGAQINTLFVGKFGFKDLPIVKELLYRKVLKKALLLPSYMKDKRYERKLNLLRQGLTMNDLLKEITI